jgi:hypothetical protein
LYISCEQRYHGRDRQATKLGRQACAGDEWADYAEMQEFSKLVPERGLEPPLPCENQVLNLARLPVPPFGHKCFIAKQFHCARRLLLCQRVAENTSNVPEKWLERGCEPGSPAISFSYQHH